MQGAFALMGAMLLASPAMSLPTTPTVEDRATGPQVAISPDSTVIGLAAGKVEKFAGIPFADSPTGNLRLRPPQKLTTSLGSAFEAIDPAAACPQMIFSTAGNNFITDVLGEVLQTPLFAKALNIDEDCLTVSVMRPAGVDANASLPVLFWIFGGAFEVSRHDFPGHKNTLIDRYPSHSSVGHLCMTPRTF